MHAVPGGGCQRPGILVALRGELAEWEYVQNSPNWVRSCATQPDLAFGEARPHRWPAAYPQTAGALLMQSPGWVVAKPPCSGPLLLHSIFPQPRALRVSAQVASWPYGFLHL